MDLKLEKKCDSFSGIEEYQNQADWTQDKLPALCQGL